MTVAIDAAVETRERVLQGAEACVRRFGLRRWSMADAAAAGGVSRGSVYRYFPDRDALVDAVLERTADRFVAASATRVHRRRTLAAQVGEAAVFVRAHQRDTDLTLALPSEESLLATLLTVRADRLVASFVDFWLPLLADADRRGEIRTDLDHRVAAEWIVRMLLSLALMPSVVIDLDDPDAVRAFVHDHIVHGLAPRPTRSRP
jgi:AcrR family transcriptional regulator